MPDTKRRRLTHPLTLACAVLLVAILGAFYFANRPPRGESEIAIWNAIEADKRIVGSNDAEVTLVRWRRGAHIGDQAPTDLIVVRTDHGLYQVEASAYCVVPDGWRASIGAVIKLGE
ncbi:MAG: hypothetical protein AAGG48_31940 [Planctomycetota bacterium]